MANRTEDDYKLYFEYKAALIILKTVPPILIIFGTIGNVLSIVVLTKRTIRKSPTALYLICLTFSDLLVLNTGLLRQWLVYLFKFDVRHINQTVCKIHIWLVYSSLDFSSWMLIAVTLERITSVWCPVSARSKHNRKNAAILIITILILVLGLNSHLLYGMVNKINANKTERKCVAINRKYSMFFRTVWAWIDLCAFCLIPFGVIVVGNSLIIFKVLKSSQKAKRKLSLASRRGSHSYHHQSSMTAILLTLNTVFLLTTLPVSIYDIRYPIWIKTENQQVIARLELWWAIVNLLMYTNNALNFLMYTLGGSRFREEFKRIFSRRKSSTENKLYELVQAQPDSSSGTLGK